jgi:hypothetical protein
MRLSRLWFGGGHPPCQSGGDAERALLAYPIVEDALLGVKQVRGDRGFAAPGVTCPWRTRISRPQSHAARTRAEPSGRRTRPRSVRMPTRRPSHVSGGKRVRTAAKDVAGAAPWIVALAVALSALRGPSSRSDGFAARRA